MLTTVCHYFDYFECWPQLLHQFLHHILQDFRESYRIFRSIGTELVKKTETSASKPSKSNLWSLAQTSLTFTIGRLKYLYASRFIPEHNVISISTQLQFIVEIQYDIDSISQNFWRAENYVIAWSMAWSTASERSSVVAESLPAPSMASRRNSYRHNNDASVPKGSWARMLCSWAAVSVSAGWPIPATSGIHTMPPWHTAATPGIHTIAYLSSQDAPLTCYTVPACIAVQLSIVLLSPSGGQEGQLSLSVNAWLIPMRPSNSQNDQA